MRTFALASLALALAIVPAPPAVAQEPQVPTQDSVTGTGSFFSTPPPFGLSFSFDAHSGPSGENPTGTAFGTARAPFLEFSSGGQVACLNVSGQRATVGASSNFNGNIDQFFFVTSDGFVRWGILEPGTTVSGCPLESAGLAFSFVVERTMTSGGFVIVDAPALPTSKDQCKNGGWKTFGVFKNQGDCVSFVATGGKNSAERSVG
jgi:hypothetical protein